MNQQPSTPEVLKTLLNNELDQMHRMHQSFVMDQALHHQILLAAGHMAKALRNQNKILCCGNGGSMSDAMHLAEELSGRFRKDRPALAALALSDPGFLTCAANDFGYEAVFERGVEALGRPGDVLVGISTSGRSANVLRACRKAKERGMLVLGLGSGDGGELASVSDVCLGVPTEGTADRAQESHIRIIHLWLALLEKELFGI
ncbi:MAG: D-sedoheptulose-7-phosphate isomerase [Bacteroidia bacterium]|jgi:D-sedoheptulose 7-phosphate isomerase